MYLYLPVLRVLQTRKLYVNCVSDVEGRKEELGGKKWGIVDHRTSLEAKSDKKTSHRTTITAKCLSIKSH